ncbi:MAG TPA: type II toxin-antitoxin system VapC family toxin [Lacipirellula sp.]
MFLFDTDHVVIIQGRSPELRDAIFRRIAAYSLDDFYVSIVTFHEQVTAWQSYLNREHRSRQIVRAYAELSRLLGEYTHQQLIPFDEAAAEKFEALRKQRVRIGTMDLRIASIALVNGYTVLTRNLVDFEKVPGLKVEDWTATPDKPR